MPSDLVNKIKPKIKILHKACEAYRQISLFSRYVCVRTHTSHAMYALLTLYISVYALLTLYMCALVALYASSCLYMSTYCLYMSTYALLTLYIFPHVTRFIRNSAWRICFNMDSRGGDGGRFGYARLTKPLYNTNEALKTN